MLNAHNFQINNSPHACFATLFALVIHSGTQSSLLPQHFVRLVWLFSELASGRWLNAVVQPCHGKVFGAISAFCNGTHTLFNLAHLRFAYKHQSLFHRVKRCSTLLDNKFPITLNIKVDLRMCFTHTSVINLALLPEQHSPQIMSPTQSYLKVTQHLSSIADGEDEDPMTVKVLSSNKHHLLQCLKIMVFRRHGDPEQFNVQSKDEEYGEVPLPPQVFPHEPQNFVHPVRDYWRNQSKNDALRYQQEQFENAVPEHQRADVSYSLAHDVQIPRH